MPGIPDLLVQSSFLLNEGVIPIGVAEVLPLRIILSHRLYDSLSVGSKFPGIANTALDHCLHGWGCQDQKTDAESFNNLTKKVQNGFCIPASGISQILHLIDNKERKRNCGGNSIH